MKYAICTPLAVFCCPVELNSQQLIHWLNGGSARGGVYENVYHIHQMLLRRTFGVWIVDSVLDTLP